MNSESNENVATPVLLNVRKTLMSMNAYISKLTDVIFFSKYLYP